MGDRHKQHIRRHSVLDDDQLDTETPIPEASDTGKRKRRRGLKRLIPFIILAVMGLMIAKQEIPAMERWWEKTFSPKEWRARETCEQAAIAAARAPQSVRVLKRGKLHPTENGFYLERLVVGEMGPRGAEEHVEYSCYTNATGSLSKLNRLTTLP